MFIERLHCINNLTSQQINVDSILALNTFYLLKKITRNTPGSAYMEVYGDLAQKSQELSDQLENTRDFLNFQVKNAGFYAFLL